MVVLEPADLKALRIAEVWGWFPEEAELSPAGLDEAEYGRRLERLLQGGLIRSFHLTLVVPPLLGGNWVMAALQVKSDDPHSLAEDIVSRLPFVTEIFINTSLPSGIGHSLALIFYSRDFKNETRFIQNFSATSEVEVFRVEEYTFPVSLPLSREERAFLQFLYQNPTLPPGEIARSFGQSVNWVKAKISRLYWSRNNPAGVFRMQPSIDWSRCANFGHFHFLLETGHKPEMLEKMIAGQGFELVFWGRTGKRRYVEVESDVWGVADLLDRVSFLEKINGVRVAGVVHNRETIINDRWVKNIVSLTG